MYGCSEGLYQPLFGDRGIGTDVDAFDSVDIEFTRGGMAICQEMYRLTREEVRLVFY